MAFLVERNRRGGDAFQVRWRQDGAWQSDIFDTKRKALRFTCDVEDAGNQWPEGWVPGYGYAAASAAAEPGADTAFSALAEQYLNTRTSVSSYQMTRYCGMVRRLGQHFTVVQDIDDQAVATWVQTCSTPVPRRRPSRTTTACSSRSAPTACAKACSARTRAPLATCRRLGPKARAGQVAAVPRPPPYAWGATSAADCFGVRLGHRRAIRPEPVPPPGRTASATRPARPPARRSPGRGASARARGRPHAS